MNTTPTEQTRGFNLTFHHVGVGTTRFEAAVRLYETIGYTMASCVDDRDLGVKVGFLSNRAAQSPWIEILSPLGDGGPLRSLIDRGLLPSPYHTCYSVPDLSTAQTVFRNAGLIRITRAAPALAFGGAQVAFFYSDAAGMIELVESPHPLEHLIP